MEGPTKKLAIINNIAIILRCRIEDVQCLDYVPMAKLSKLRMVLQAAMDRAHEE